jgi:hypothetical protein
MESYLEHNSQNVRVSIDTQPLSRDAQIPALKVLSHCFSHKYDPIFSLEFVQFIFPTVLYLQEHPA